MKYYATAPAVKSVSRPGFVSRFVILGILLVSLVWLAACNSSDSVTFPQPSPQEPMNWLFDITGTADNDIWACGNTGAMFHYDGSQWTYQDMGTDKPIVHMYRADDGTIYACGHGGGIWRENGGSWSAMDSGTSADLYGIGSYLGNIHACGQDGALRRLAGNAWTGVSRNVMILRDEQGAPQDTLYQDQDVAALLTVNYFAIGGAYYNPNYEGPDIGILGTRGMVLAEDNEYDWILRPLGGDELYREEWVISSFSDPDVPENNYLGTSEGWLYRLNDDNSWVLEIPKVTNDPHGGIRGIWLDAQKNVYLATDEGQIVFQTSDFDFATGQGSRVVLVDLPFPFTAIWGTDPGNLYLVGLIEDTIIHASHDQATGDFTWDEVPVTFPAKAAAGSGACVDPLGLPVR